MSSRLLWMRLLFAALLVFITYLTLTPNPDDTSGFAAARYVAKLLFGDAQFADKIGHFAAYGALGAAAFWAETFIFGRKRWTPLLLAAYGAILEGVQGLGGVRTPEFADGLANALGALSGFIGAYILAQLVRKVRAR